MAEVLTTLNTAKYSEYETRLGEKRRRLAELSENDLVRINTQINQWVIGAISGNAAVMAAAIIELESIYDEDITPPVNNIGAVITESNTRRGVGVTLAAGSNAITFSSALTTTTYSLCAYPYTASGGNIQYSIDPASRTVNGFTIVTASAGKLDYIALEN